jgi:hypothetical protein
MTEVAVVSMAALKVKTTLAFDATPVAPVAGTTDTMVGAARPTWARRLIALTIASNPEAPEARTKRGNAFKIISVTC